MTSQSPNLPVGQVHVHQVGFPFVLFNFLNVWNVNIHKNKFKFMFYINAFWSNLIKNMQIFFKISFRKDYQINYYWAIQYAPARRRTINGVFMHLMQLTHIINIWHCMPHHVSKSHTKSKWNISTFQTFLSKLM